MEQGLMQRSLRLMREIISGPFIIGMIIPVILLDICVVIFQWVCFPLYNIPFVNRSEYFQFQRSNLPYLNPLRKFHCFYCSYFHGVIDYTREIAGCVERYWCPIKEKKKRPIPHSQYDVFCEYDDKEDYQKRAFDIGEFKE